MDEETIMDLLHDFQDLFLMKFFKMEGTLGDLGEMKIPLNLDVKLVKKKPYRLNMRYKERVKTKIERILDVGIIEPIEESDWISAMVVQDKKTCEV